MRAVRSGIGAALVSALASAAPAAGAFVIERSAEWIPSTPCTAVAPGSALDFSRFGFADGPCGKYGRIVTQGDHFEFENRPGEPVRFMGVNLCGTGNYLPPDESCQLVENLVRLGYNSIRLHHHDDAWAKNADRLDALMAACREKGVYVTTDLFVSRKVAWRDIGEDRDGNVGAYRFEVLRHFHDGAKSNYLAYARAFLEHVNPFTGLRYADDPTLAWLSLANEDNLCNWDIEPYKEYEALVLPKWRAWLAKRRAENPEYAKVPDTIPDAVLKIPADDRVVAFEMQAGENADRLSAKAHVIAFQQFLATLESESLREMRAFLVDEIGCKALLTDMNGYRFTAPEQLVRRQFDYVDDHFYYAHPAFLGKGRRLPARISGTPDNPIRKNDEFGVPYNVMRRVFGRPFTVSEYNYCPPWRNRAVCAFTVGATAALQDWSALWRFDWTCSSHDAVDSRKKYLNHFDMAGDPCALATERAIVCLFLRRDLPEHGEIYPNLYPPSELRKPDEKTEDPTHSGAIWAAWRVKVGALVAEETPAGVPFFKRFSTTKPEKTMDEIVADIGCRPGDMVSSPGGAVTVDRKRGSITVDTPCTAGGFVETAGRVETKAFRADVEGGQAAVWASSLDGAPLGESGRMLFTLMGDVQNDGIEYEDETMSVLKNWGKQEGRIARRVRAEVSLAVRPDAAWTVFALWPDGSRKREIPSDLEDGRLSFVADVGGDPDEAEFFYEIQTKKP